MAAPKRYMITSALPYANGPLHIGHIAGAYLPADIYVRYLRGRGRDVVWICGSDEHGAAITLRAKKEGTTPREIVDRYHGQISKAFKDFGLEFDLYHRTSSEEHHANAQAFFTQLNNQCSFEVKTSEQYYDAAQQQFLADRYITGECPNCGNPNAYGDQCERCGKDLSPIDLINPKSTLSGEAPELRETSLWYLPMDRHEGWLKEWVENGKFEGKAHHNPADWKNHVLGQCRSWIDGGLKARAMTRDLDWGVPVPVEGADGKVLYVWLDAPIGYISATQEWARKNGKDWEPYWKDEDTQLVHFIGKDNIVFHCIIFPILLKEHGGYILPTNVPANEFMNLENDKISTSRNWAVWLHEYLEEFPGKQDELRYVLCAIMPEQRDSEFTWTDYRDRVNNELADVLGNFMNRAVVLTHKYYGGEVPSSKTLQPEDQSALEELAAAPEKIADLIERYRFREAQLEAMNVARLGNRYLADAEPWKLQKTDPERVKTIMHTTLQIAANCAVLLEPFLPNTCAKIREALHVTTPWDGAGGVLLEPGKAIDKLPILFQKVDEEIIEAQRAKLAAGKPQEVQLEPAKDAIAFEPFTGLDIRVATILEAEAVPKTKKLLKLKVDTGIDQRTVVSGIAEHYAPEDIIGQQVSLLINLEPRKIRGVESQGMILMAEDAEGKLRFIAPTEAMGPGSTIR